MAKDANQQKVRGTEGPKLLMDKKRLSIIVEEHRGPSIRGSVEDNLMKNSQINNNETDESQKLASIAEEPPSF
jgi:hypothetical protein